MNYTCYLISNKPQYYSKIKENLMPEELLYFDGEGYSSFSQLVNTCISQCPTEIVIILSDKVLPSHKDIKKMLDLINKGYGLVGLYRFGFFGFKKELMRRIGMFDERYASGGYEDDDFYIRLKEANISMYITEEVPYEKRPSSWNYSISREHFLKKWSFVKQDNGETDSLRNLSEVLLNYSLGPSVDTNFLPWNMSVANPSKSRKYI
jgi:hypothetical protein